MLFRCFVNSKSFAEDYDLVLVQSLNDPTIYLYMTRCMDLDGDGVLSMYELEYFYEEQLQRMEQLGIETLPFDDCLCQVGCFCRDNLKI